MSNNLAVEAAKKMEKGTDGIVTLSTGVRVRLHAVSASLISEILSSIKEPDVPMWHNPDRDKDEPNPDDPNYIKAMESHREAQGRASMDTMVMFGVELIDGVPEDDTWIKQLRIMEKLGRLDLSTFDIDGDKVDREFIYKRYFATNISDLDVISEASAISEEDLAVARKTFPGEEG